MYVCSRNEKIMQSIESILKVDLKSNTGLLQYQHERKRMYETWIKNNPTQLVPFIDCQNLWSKKIISDIILLYKVGVAI